MGGFFKSLFRCTPTTLQQAFSGAKVRNKFSGLSLLAMEVALQNKLEVQVGGRFFIIISRKVGGACERNKLRRRLKAIYFQEGFYRYPWVTIIIGYPGATKYNFAQLKQLVMRHFATLPEAGNAREKEIKSA